MKQYNKLNIFKFYNKLWNCEVNDMLYLIIYSKSILIIDIVIIVCKIFIIIYDIIFINFNFNIVDIYSIHNIIFNGIVN